MRIAGKAEFLKFELVNGDARRKKVALQEISKLYRSGNRLNAEARNDFENAINGMVLVKDQDEKVVRWCLNALAQLGRRGNSDTYVELALRQYEGNPEITAAGVAALSQMYRGNIESIPVLGSVELR